VVLCDQVDHVLRAREQAPESDIVALTAECAWFCQEHDIRYLRLDDFCPDAAINELAEATLRRQYRWAAWVDTQLKQAIPQFAEACFEPGRGHLYFLKYEMDRLLLPAWYLQKFIEEAKPERLIAFERPAFCPDIGAFPWPERPLFALLAPALVRQDTEVQLWRGSFGDPPRARPASRLRRLYGRLPRLRARMTREITMRWRNLFARRARIAWIGDAYGLVFVWPHVQSHGLAVVRPLRATGFGNSHQPGAERMRSLLKDEWARLSAMPEFWQPLDASSPSLRPFAEAFFKRWLLHHVPLAWAQFLGARAWLEKGRFAAVVGVDVQNLLTSSVYMAAAALGITRVLNMHHDGGMYVDFPAQDIVGPMQADYYLVSSEEDVAYFEGMKKRTGALERARIVPVGSAKLEALRVSHRTRKPRRRIKDTKPTILYVPTQLRGSHRYFCEGNISDITYFELEQRILRCCAEFRNVRVLYKKYPYELATNPIDQFISRSVPNGDVSFAPLIDEIMRADAIIIDFPSTALTEALMTDKPLLVYAGRDWARMFPRARNALMKRAWVSETPDEFEAQVRQFLTAGNFAPIANPDREFVRRYITYTDDGKSAQRTAQVIAEIVLAKRASSRLEAGLGNGR
jgi:hypothetical protein